MIFQKFIYLLVLSGLVMGVLAHYSKSAQPQERLYGFRVKVYEPVLTAVIPTRPAKNDFIKQIVNQRWQELNQILYAESFNAQESEVLLSSFSDSARACQLRASQLLRQKQWQDAQDVLAFCMVMPYAYERTWLSSTFAKERQDFMKVAVELWNSSSAGFIDTRSTAFNSAQNAKDRTDFLAGLEEKTKECLVLANDASLAVTDIKPEIDRTTYAILESDINLISLYTEASRKSQGVGVYRDAWWNLSELCAMSKAVLVTVDNVKSHNTRLVSSLNVKGFSIKK